MRRPHQLRGAKGNGGHPEQLITFDVETGPATCDPSYGSSPCPACVRIADGTMTADDEVAQLILGRAILPDGSPLSFVDSRSFWNVITALAGHTWLVNHNIAFDLMVLNWDFEMTSRGFTATKIIIPEPSGPFAVTWKHEDGRQLTMANLANWWGMRPLKSIGEIVGAPKGSVDPTAPRYRHAVPGTPDWTRLDRYCAQDAAVVRAAVEMWSRFLLDHDLGPFALTQAGQALTAYKHRFMADHEIFIHTNKRALQLERDSYYGGRTEAFRIGRYNGNFYIVDVNSLYPHVMQTETYPTALRGIVGSIGLGDLETLLTDTDSPVIARVRCAVPADDESARVVPVRWQDKLIYPVGQFDAVLTTPELRSAAAAGVLVGVDEVAVYDGARIFTSYVDELYALRMRYRSEGNLVWYEIVKVFLNSLYGKFGQYNHEWEDCSDALDLSPGTHVIVDASSGERTTYRFLGGVLKRKSLSRVEGWDSFPAIASHVTAYARSYLSSLRAAAGFSSVWYCDTDSLFVDDQGLGLLERFIDPDRLGALKLETSAASLTIRGLKDYEIGTKVKLKGIRRGATRLADGAYRQVQFRGIAGALRAGEPGVARVGQIVKKPTGKYLKGLVDAGGVVRPIVLP